MTAKVTSLSRRRLLFVWGDGASGKLGTGDTAIRLTPTRFAGLPTPVRQVAAGACNTGIVTQAGDLLMCGCRRYGKLGLGDEDDRTTPTLLERALSDHDAVLMVACSNGDAVRHVAPRLC